MCLAKKAKKFEFWRACLGKSSIVETPVFVWFSLFLISTYSKKFDPFSCSDSKLQNFGGPIEGDFPNLAPRISVGLLSALNPLKCHPLTLTQILFHIHLILIVQLARVSLFTKLLFNPKHKLLTQCCLLAILCIIYLLPHYESPALMPIIL